MAPYIDFPEHKESSSSNNDDFDWGYLLAATPGLALFALAVIIKVFLQMDIHIIYHIVVYIIVFIPLSLILKDRFLLLLYLLILPTAGEYIQVDYLSYFNFDFQMIDVVTNTIGSLIGIGIARLLSSLK